MTDPHSIRNFWNDKAKENPYWFVSSYVAYDAQRNLDEFWASGHNIWQQLKSSIGYACRPTDRIVEIGCGVGRLTRAIAPEVQHVDSFDISDEMLALARKNVDCPNVHFHRAEGFDLPGVATSTADLVLAYCVFQHLPSVDSLCAYLNDMARVAKPGGIIAFSLVARTMTDNLMQLFRARAFLREKVRRHGPRGLYRREWVGIRPNASTVCRSSPISLKRASVFAGQWLFFGTK